MTDNNIIMSDEEYMKELLAELEKEPATTIRGDNDEMIIITPGNGGRDCLGNGKHFDKNGQPIEICCEECNYEMLCYDEQREKEDEQALLDFFMSLTSSREEL